MPEIIPAIIAKNFEEVKKKIKLVEPYVKWVQLDIMDGKFVPNVTWNNPADLRNESFEINLEAHLMISEPEKYIESWITAGIKRIIFHIEAASKPEEIIKMCREKGVQAGVAMNPETPYQSLCSGTGQTPLIELVDMVLVLGVSPGFGGQKFKPEVISKIQALREANPHLTIGVDGGMNPETAKLVIDAGANVIVAGSYIYESENIEKAIDELKAIRKYD